MAKMGTASNYLASAQLLTKLWFWLLPFAFAFCAPAGDEVTQSRPTASEVEASLEKNFGLPAAVKTLATIPTDLTLVLGVPTTAKVLATLVTGAVVDVTTNVTWESADPAVVAIGDDKAAPLSPVAVGTTTVKAKLLANQVEVPVAVLEAALVGLSAGLEKQTAPVGEPVEMRVIAVFEDFTSLDVSETVRCTADQPATKLKVVGGRLKVIGGAPGAVVISCTFGELGATTALNVSDQAVERLSIVPSIIRTVPGLNSTYQVTAHYSDGSAADVTAAAAVAVVGMPDVSVSSPGTLSAAKDLTADATGRLTATVGATYGEANIIASPAKLLSLALAPAVSTLPTGATTDVAVVGSYSDDGEYTVTELATLTVDDDSVLTLEGTGATRRLRGVAAGTTTLRGEIGTVSFAQSITVGVAKLERLAVTCNAASLAAGQASSCAATGYFTNGATATLTSAVNWQSSRPTTAVIGDSTGTKGQLAAVNNTNNTYQAAITAATTDSGETITSPAVNVTITPAALVSLTLTPSSLSMAVGRTQNFSAQGVYSNSPCASCTYPDATNGAIWTADFGSSGHSDVLVVSNTTGSKGTTKGVAVGTAKVKAWLGDKVGEATVSITGKEPDSLAVDQGTSVNLDVGATTDLSLTLTYSDGSTKEATSDPNTTWSVATAATQITLHAGAVTGRVAGVSEGVVSVDVSYAEGGVSVMAVTSVRVRSRCDTGGIREGLYCYRVSALGANCTDTCSAVGGAYHTTSAAIPAADINTCRYILASADASFLGNITSNEAIINTDGLGLGCSVYVQTFPFSVIQLNRFVSPAANAGDSHPSYRRACGCTR